MLQQAVDSKETKAPSYTPPVFNFMSFADGPWPFWNASPARLNQTSLSIMKSSDEIAKLNKETAAALAKSSAALAGGLEEIGCRFMAFFHNSVADHLTAHREIFSVRTLKDFADVQSRWSTRVIEAAATEAAKFSELSGKIFSQASEPIQAHVGAMLVKFDGLR